MTEASTADTEPSQPGLHGALPDHLARPKSRRARLEAALAEIEAQYGAADKSGVDAEREAAQGRKLRGRKPGNVHAAARRAKADLDALNTKAQSAMTEHARERLAEKITAAEHGAAAAVLAAAAAPPPEIQANTTDPESRIMKTAAGWVQGFNAPGAVNAGRIVIAADVTQDHNDTHQLTPMMNAVQRNANAAGITEAIGIVVADAGYWSETNATVEGPDRLTATTKDWKQRRKARELGSTQGPPPAGASHLEAMEHRLRTPEGTATYKLRSHTIEPVFGQIKENRGMR